MAAPIRIGVIGDFPGVSLALRDERGVVRRGHEAEDSDRTALAADAVTRSTPGRSRSSSLGRACRVPRQSVQELLGNAARDRLRADARLAVRRYVTGLSIYSG